MKNMKKITTVIVFCLCFWQMSSAQRRVTVGIIGGGGGNVFLDKDTDKNSAQLNAAFGVDMGYQVWRNIYLNARSEYQQRYYFIDPYLANTYNNGNYWKSRAAFTHHLGLGLRTRSFYATAGATFTDDVSGGEQYEPNPLLCGLMTPEELKKYLESPSYETFNNWGWFLNLGWTKKIAPRTRLLSEIQCTQERFDGIKSNYMQAFGALGFRMGLQFEL